MGSTSTCSGSARISTTCSSKISTATSPPGRRWSRLDDTFRGKPRHDGSVGALKFWTNSAFQLERRRRVDEYFRVTGRRQRDCWQMYLKTAILIACLAVLYLLLVFTADAWWQSVPLAVLLGFAAAGIGFNIQHYGGHHAYSDRRWINKLMAMTLDMIGGSSYLWHWKHVVIHHTYVNESFTAMLVSAAVI